MIKYNLKLKRIYVFILLINLFYIQKNYYYYFCQKCINNETKYKKCQECSPNTLFESIKIKSRDETLNEIIKNKKSIARFGDGEFSIIFGRNISFQKYNETLKDKLIKVLNSNIPNLLVGITNINNVKDEFWINYFKNYKFNLAKVINKNRYIIVLILQDFIGIKQINK